ncbi:M56 family metallopeptidase [Lacinutrix sp. C3R15]|uniref:M56 family metallopeptidase n=1 Tax=Flavobacteriaceae TaxID=49546 RepID=UPI001C096E3F|nr:MULTISPECIES: M56 family metallopeptidase [Flavobacteriaceae]MBU2939099.1 M56 family metallopeptidase [Lacinutrix sp. C3R15]MDO6622414.1 M56 family metallopeptidase [Oceanihabitans sp. 1_MG-2023]
MEIALLKSSLCLLAFLTFYKVFLERTSNHIFKRFYLLAVIVISIGIPFITVIEYIEPQNTIANFQELTDFSKTKKPTIKETTNYTPMVLWSIYGIGVLLFLTRFIYNLTSILLKIKRNPKQKSTNYTHVLLKELVIPHTFFSYIFLNKTTFKNKKIPEEVLLHEQTHAQQKHSADILFIELLQIIFWFHPLVYLLKKHIKLNHEFLADQAVLNHGIESTNYLKTLLSFSSNQQELTLEHAINYSSIKKRFTIMKTQTSKQTFWLRSLLLLPLLGILIFSFSTKKQVEKEKEPLFSEITKKTLPTINDHKIGCNNCKIELSEKDFTQLKLNTTTEDEVIYFEVKFPGQPTLSVHSNFLNKKAITFLNENKSNEDIQILNIKTKKETLDAYILIQLKKGDIKQETLPTINGITCDGSTLNLSKKGIENLILGTTTNQKIESFLFKIAGKSTVKIIGNSLNEEAKNQLNNLKIGTMVQLFNLKTETDKLPPILINLVAKNDKNYSQSPMVKKGEVSDIPPPPAAPKVLQGEISNIPPPPPPKSPLDHVIDMEKKGAIFYFEGKKITSDEAIAILKANKELNISTKTNNDISVVNITTKGITIDD